MQKKVFPVKKKGGIGTVITICALLAVIFILLVIISLKPSPTPQVIKTPPKVEVTNPNHCLDQKDPFGLFDAECTLTVKNYEQYPIQLKPVFGCWKLSSPSDIKYIQLGDLALLAEGTKEFTVKYDNDGRDWSCKITNLGIKA